MLDYVINNIFQNIFACGDLLSYKISISFSSSGVSRLNFVNVVQTFNCWVIGATGLRGHYFGFCTKTLLTDVLSPAVASTMDGQLIVPP